MASCDTVIVTEVVLKTSNNARMNITRWLQLHPQKYIIECLMKSLYAGQIHTESEWFAIYDDTMNSEA